MGYTQTVEALTLSRRNVGEADRLVTFFTKEMGLLKVLAKGVRKIPSRRGGHLEPLTIVSATVAGKDGRWYLSAVETVDYLSGLHRELEAQNAAQFLARLAAGFFAYEVSQPEVFSAVRRAWMLLAGGSYDDRLLVETAAVMLVLREAGVMIQLKNCRVCGVDRPEGKIKLDPEKGGWVCVGCHSGAKLALEISDLQCLRTLSKGPRGTLRLVRGEEGVSKRLSRAIRYYADRSVFAVN